MREDERVGSNSAHAPPTIIQSSVQVSGRPRHYLPYLKVLRRWASGDGGRRRMSLGVPSHRPARRRHKSDGRLQLTRGDNVHSYPSCASEQSFLGPVLLSPIRGRGYKRSPKHHSPHADLAANRGCLVIHSAVEKAQRLDKGLVRDLSISRHGMFAPYQIAKMPWNVARHSSAENLRSTTSTSLHSARLGFMTKATLKKWQQGTQSTGGASPLLKRISRASGSLSSHR